MVIIKGNTDKKIETFIGMIIFNYLSIVYKHSKHNQYSE